MDDAHNQRRLREECGWTDTKIAEFYKISPPYVGTLKKLLLLPTNIQLMVHTRQISVQAAVAMTDLTPEEQKAVIAPETATTATDPGTPTPESAAAPAPVTSAVIIKRTREKKIQQGGKQARTLKELRDFLEGFTGPAESPPIKAFAETFLKFIQGTYTDATMEKKLKGFLVAMPEPEIAGLEATVVPEVPSVFTTPLEAGEVTEAVPETMSFPVETVETTNTLAEAA